MTHIQSSNGNYLNLDYNTGGYVSDAYTSDGQSVSYQYDDFGDLVLAVSPDESEETYEYQHVPFTNNGTTVFGFNPLAGGRFQTRWSRFAKCL